MAIFQHRATTLHYDLLAHAVPMDTLFLHDHLGSARWWQNGVQELRRKYSESDSAGNLCLVDLIGHGASAGPEDLTQLNFDRMAEDLRALSLGLGLSDVALVGHGYGGLLALNLLRLDPQLFTRAILLSPRWGGGLKVTKSRHEQVQKAVSDRASAISFVQAQVSAHKLSEPLLTQLAGDVLKTHTLAQHNFLDAAQALVLGQDLGQMKQSVLVVYGDADSSVEKRDVQSLAQGLAQGDFLELKGVGHALALENPQRFAEIASEFLYEE